MLHLQLLAPEWGWKAQWPVFHLTVRSVQLHVHMQWAGVNAGGIKLGSGRWRGRKTPLFKDLLHARLMLGAEE